MNEENETLTEQADEFALTRALRALNGKLRDGIVGVLQRAYRVAKAIVLFIKDLIVRLIKDGLPWLFRLIWNIIKFLFGRKMFNLIKENLILIILLPMFIVALAWPFFVYKYYSDAAYWLWIGWAWLLGIGLVGAWIGFKKGLYSKWSKFIKNRRAKKLAAKTAAAV